MFEMKKLNVHKLVETEEEKEKLLTRGFVEVIEKVIEEVKEVKEVKKGK